MRLYHTAHDVIEHPDVMHGRKNADFGQGFYTSMVNEFAGKWARELKDQKVYVNEYEIDTEDLRILELKKDENWYRYIKNNRSGNTDMYEDYDIIIGPVANDTIYDTFGILTSSLIDEKTAVEVLKIGPSYTQVAIKTEKAGERLIFVGASEIPSEELREHRKLLMEEEANFQKEVADYLLAGQD